MANPCEARRASTNVQLGMHCLLLSHACLSSPSSSSSLQPHQWVSSPFFIYPPPFPSGEFLVYTTFTHCFNTTSSSFIPHITLQYEWAIKQVHPPTWAAWSLLHVPFWALLSFPPTWVNQWTEPIVWLGLLQNPLNNWTKPNLTTPITDHDKVGCIHIWLNHIMWQSQWSSL